MVHKSYAVVRFHSLLITGEIFFYKIYFFHLEGFAVQVAQATGIGGEAEGQLIGVERLIVPVKALVQLAVFAVAKQGVSRMGKLGANLMGSSGNQLTLHQ